jgi:hypothetical protein
MCVQKGLLYDLFRPICWTNTDSQTMSFLEALRVCWTGHQLVLDRVAVNVAAQVQQVGRFEQGFNFIVVLE